MEDGVGGERGSLGGAGNACPAYCATADRWCEFVRRIAVDIGCDVAGDRVREEADAAAQDGLAVAPGREGEGGAGLGHNAFEVLEILVLPGLEGGVVGDVGAGLVAVGEKGGVGAGVAIFLAGRIALEFKANAVGEVQIAAELPLILHVKVEAVETGVDGVADGEGLSVAAAFASAVDEADGEVGEIGEGVRANDGTAGDVVVADAIVPVVDAGLESGAADAVGKVVDDAELLTAAAGGENGAGAGESAAGGAAVGATVVEVEQERQGGGGGGVVGVAAADGVPVAVQDEVVHQPWGDRVGVVQLRDGPWLHALLIEERADGAGAGGLGAGVPADAEVDLLLVVDGVIDAAGDEGFGVDARGGGAECDGAGDLAAELRTAGAVDERAGEGLFAAAEVVAAVLEGKRAICNRDGSADARCTVVGGKEGLVDGQRGGGDMGQCVALELRRRQRDDAAGGQGVPQAFGVGEKIKPIAERGATDGGGVLIGDGAGARRLAQLVEVVVRVKEAAVVVFDQIAVETVGAGSGDVVDLGAGFAAILRAVGVGDDGGFRDVVGAEGVVAGPGLVVEVVRLDDVRAVDGEKDGVEGQTVDVEVCVATADVDAQAGRGEGDVCDVSAIDRGVLDERLAVAGDLVAVFGL